MGLLDPVELPDRVDVLGALGTGLPLVVVWAAGR
jgi:hypothetical protein